MFPAGYGNFSYSCKIGRSFSQTTTDVACGTGNIEMVTEEELRIRGLKLPEGNLTIDKEKGEISIHRSLALPEKELSVVYDRIYPSQYGFDEMMRRMRRTLKKAHIYEPCERFRTLSDLFNDYLVSNLSFTEKTTFSRDTSPEAWIQGMVKFSPIADGKVPEEQAEYSIGLSDSFIEELTEACQKDDKTLSTRRRNILARKEEPLGIDTFLRAVDIYPATSKYEDVKARKNLGKCVSFLSRILFKDYI